MRPALSVDIICLQMISDGTILTARRKPDGSGRAGRSRCIAGRVSHRGRNSEPGLKPCFFALIMVTSVCRYANGCFSVAKNNTKSKDRYNEAAYARYTVRVRKDSALYKSIEVFMGKKGTSLNYLAVKLLEKHFSGEEERGSG